MSPTGNTKVSRHRHAAGMFVGGCVAATTAISLGTHLVDARSSKPKVDVLLSSDKTIIGEPIVYPNGAQAKVTAMVITLEPGQETGWHVHGVPLFGRVLEGELTVDYGPHGQRVFRTGDVLMETLNAAHNGRNTGTGRMRVLAVVMGAEGRPNSTPVAKPE